MKYNKETIQEESTNQGTSKFDASMVSYLRTGYFKAEPRSTLYWLRMIRSIAASLESYGSHWNEILPKSLSNTLLAEYINDPRGAIARGRFTAEEIKELRQPQRIMLFFFLKKMARFKDQNKAMILQTNNAIARTIFNLSPFRAIPDSGYVVLYNSGESPVEVLVGDVLEAIIEGEPVTRKYEVTSALIGNTMLLDEFISGVPGKGNKEGTLILSKEALPLTSQIAPFRYEETMPIHHEYIPSLLINSPVLYLTQGERTIHLTLQSDTLLSLDANLFCFEITTANGWLSMPNETTITMDTPIVLEDGFEFVFHITKDCQPIVPFRIVEVGTANSTNYTSLKIYYSGDAGHNFMVSSASLHVMVAGLTPRAIRNQDQVIDPSSNYMPFGLDALLQSVLSFSDMELSNPYLDEISAHLIWASKPKNLTDYYKAYHKTEENFKVALRTVFRADEALSYTTITNNKAAQLFGGPITFTSVLSTNTDLSKTASWDTEELDPLLHDVYYEMELNTQDFGERQYPLLMSNYAIEYAAYESSLFKIFKKEPVQVNMPYTPEMSALEIDYSSTIVRWNANEDSTEGMHLYKNAPLGFSKYTGDAIEFGEDENGLLYFGISNLSTSSTGNLYFNGPVGNARAEEATVHWWYMSSNGWASLQKNILTDGTFGLTQTGLLNFSVPEDISANSTEMPNGTFWLKVTISSTEIAVDGCTRMYTSFQHSIMKLDGVFANAMSISRQQDELEVSDDVSYLAAGTELFFEEPAPEYLVKLPFNTDGESLKETQIGFWTRAFNGVRNRGRMVAIEDVENLMLYHFRNLILVKCIPRQSGSNLVEVVVVNKQFYGKIPYAIPPLNSITELERMKNEMLPLTSPFFKTSLEFKVINPVYREVGFSIQAEFSKNTDATEDENIQRLYNDVQYYINPWFFEKYQIPKFGYWFDYGGIVGYLQSQPYIAAVLDVTLSRESLVEKTAVEACASFDDEILIFSDEKSSVAVVNLQDYEQFGIDEMIVGEDFYVSDSEGQDN